MWQIILIDFLLLNQKCISGTNLPYSWYINFLYISVYRWLIFYLITDMLCFVQECCYLIFIYLTILVRFERQNAGLVKWNEMYFLFLYSLGKVLWKTNYFFLECVVELLFKVVWVWCFLCGKVFIDFESSLLKENMYFLVFSETLIPWQVNHNTFTLPNYNSIIIYEKEYTYWISTNSGWRLLNISVSMAEFLASQQKSLNNLYVSNKKIVSVVYIFYKSGFRK